MAEYIEKDKIVKWIWKQERLAKASTVIVIEETPAADVAPVVHGRWEKSERFTGYVCCSACQDCHILPEWAVRNKWRYCPNCGAKMDGEAREDDT